MLFVSARQRRLTTQLCGPPFFLGQFPGAGRPRLWKDIAFFPQKRHIYSILSEAIQSLLPAVFWVVLIFPLPRPELSHH